MINQAMMGSPGGGTPFFDPDSGETIAVTVGNSAGERGLKTGSFGSRSPTTYDAVTFNDFYTNSAGNDAFANFASDVNGTKGIVINRTGSGNWWHFDRDSAGAYSISASSPSTAAGLQFVFTVFDGQAVDFTIYKIN